MNLLPALVFGLVFAAVLYYAAARKKANRTFWAVMGFFFGPLALPFILLAGPEAKDKKSILARILGRRKNGE